MLDIGIPIVAAGAAASGSGYEAIAEIGTVAHQHPEHFSLNRLGEIETEHIALHLGLGPGEPLTRQSRHFAEQLHFDGIAGLGEIEQCPLNGKFAERESGINSPEIKAHRPKIGTIEPEIVTAGVVGEAVVAILGWQNCFTAAGKDLQRRCGHRHQQKAEGERNPHETPCARSVLA